MKQLVRWLYSGVVISLMVSCSLSEQYPRSETLYVGGFQWGAPESFNPYSSNPAWPVTGAVTALYETLFMYNQLTGGVEPLLGAKYAFEGDTAVVVTLQDRAHWSNGEPLTAKDVVESYLFNRTYSTGYSASVSYFDSVFITGPYEITLQLSQQNFNPLAVEDVFCSLPILPHTTLDHLQRKALRRLGSTKDMDTSVVREKIFRIIQSDVMDNSPVGSGPYVLDSYSKTKIALKRNESYWGNTVLYNGKAPAPRYIVHMLYQSNEKYSLGLQTGLLDFTRTFMSMVGYKKSVGTWLLQEPFYLSGAIVTLVPNLAQGALGFTPPAVLQDRSFRQAMAAAINYDVIQKVAMNGYTAPFRAGYIIDGGSEKRFFHGGEVAQYGITYAPKLAREILRDGGYGWGENGKLHFANGEVVPPLAIMTPRGWSDWETATAIVVEGLNAVGIAAYSNIVDETTYQKNMERGFFDMVLNVYQSDHVASLPWSRFNQTIRSGHTQKVGPAVFSNVGRFSDSTFDALIDSIPLCFSDSLQLKNRYQQLNIRFMEHLPVVPLMYRPSQFYQFSTKWWGNFPTEKNPYAPPQSLMQGAGIKALWHITPVVKGEAR